MKMAGLLYGTLSTEDACEAQDPPLE
jgi:hypothetical protein